MALSEGPHHVLQRPSSTAGSIQCNPRGRSKGTQAKVPSVQGSWLGPRVTSPPGSRAAARMGGRPHPGREFWKVRPGGLLRKRDGDPRETGQGQQLWERPHHMQAPVLRFFHCPQGQCPHHQSLFSQIAVVTEIQQMDQSTHQQSSRREGWREEAKKERQEEEGLQKNLPYNISFCLLSKHWCLATVTFVSWTAHGTTGHWL